jgi:hypothetical protein
VCVVTALAPLAVLLVLGALLPLGIGLGAIKQRRVLSPAGFGLAQLLMLTAWIWCVGVALTGSWRLASIAAPVFALVIGIVIARTEQTPTQ